MSADNWARCPRCTAQERHRLDVKADDVASLYGSVPVEEFDKARNDLDAERTAFEQRPFTFREDYEFYGAENGVITANYSGHCEKCGLSLSFQDEHPIAGWDL